MIRQITYNPKRRPLTDHCANQTANQDSHVSGHVSGVAAQANLAFRCGPDYTAG
jgi:hypothetical protein